MTTTANPSWTLSRYVRAAIVCKGQKVNGRTATAKLISEVAANVGATGYDARTVRAILLDKSLAGTYPAEAPAAYAGR